MKSKISSLPAGLNTTSNLNTSLFLDKKQCLHRYDNLKRLFKNIFISKYNSYSIIEVRSERENYVFYNYL